MPVLQRIPFARAGTALDDARILVFDTQKYPLAETVSVASGVFDLARLHEAPEILAKGEGPSYQHNVHLRQELDTQLRTTRFPVIYASLIRDVVSPLFGGRLSYSKRPQMRVHLEGSPSASVWHTDHQVIGRVDQVNAWLPLVDTWGTNTLWVESDYGAGDHQPIPVRYGEVLLFDGTWLEHGTMPNNSGRSRISIDFRFAPLTEGVLEKFFPTRAGHSSLSRTNIETPAAGLPRV